MFVPGMVASMIQTLVDVKRKNASIVKRRAT